MSIPTNDDVEAVFDSLGGQIVRPMALKLALEKRGFDALSATDAINRAIADGVFGETPAGGLFLRTKV